MSIANKTKYNYQAAPDTESDRRGLLEVNGQLLVWYENMEHDVDLGAYGNVRVTLIGRSMG